MHIYEPKTFAIPELNGISAESVKQHLSLYDGYVKSFMGICALMGDLATDASKNGPALAELQRRLSFEFDGMRLHEYYFTQFEDGPAPLTPDGALARAVSAQWGSSDMLPQLMTSIASMRGPGWAMLYLDNETGVLQPAFIGEQHQGHFVGLPVILALDVWEHAYLLDYGAIGKARYVEAFFKNLNWSVIEKRFEAATKN